MDKKKLIPIISIISVAIMIIWGTIEGSYEHSWLAVFVGGIAITVISILDKKK